MDNQGRSQVLGSGTINVAANATAAQFFVPFPGYVPKRVIVFILQRQGSNTASYSLLEIDVNGVSTFIYDGLAPRENAQAFYVFETTRAFRSNLPNPRYSVFMVFTTANIAATTVDYLVLAGE